MRKILLLLWGVILLSAQLLAQTRTITGKVTDIEGQPIPNTSVTVKGSSKGTTTNANGTFTITVPTTVKELIISSIGYASQNLRLGSGNTVTVSLTSLVAEITTVVVTGYTREKKSQFTGAASVVSAKNIEDVPVGAFDQVLQGRAPGLLINSGSGQPGSSARVAIRGVQSISGAFAQPLYVVDGVPLEAAVFQSLNPNDFESVTVLKDASAAALYGSRAGNGVIVITTKRGKAGATNFGYRTQFGFTETPKWNNFDMMNTEELLSYEERLQLNAPGWVYSKNNPAYAGLPATSPSNNPFAASQARYDFILDSIRSINNDPLDLLFRNGFSQLHELNTSGGSDKTKFFISGSYFDQEGIELRSELQRYTTRLNFDHQANKLLIQFNSTAGFATSNFSEGELIGNSARNSFQIAWRGRPYENPYKPDGTLNAGTNTGLTPRLFANTLEGIQNTEYWLKQFKANMGLSLSYEILPYLKLKNTFGVDHRNDRLLRWINPNSLVGATALFNKGLNSEMNEVYTQLINTSSINFSEKFDRHEVDAGAFFEVIRNYNKALGFTVYNLDPRLPQTGQGAGSGTSFPPSATSAKSGYGIRSYFGRVRYTYDGKYTINAGLRRDGTSRILNEDNKEITTWSVGATWNAGLEGFIKDQDLITDLVVRASYGVTPNIGSIPTGTYGIVGLVNLTNYLSSQVPAYAGGANYAGALSITGISPSTPGNPNLEIESVKKFNVGADIGFWRNRVRLSVDYYNNKTVDLFVTQPLPRTSGFTSTNINAGIMSNKGIELQATVDVYRSDLLDITVGGNHAYNKNKIEDLGLVDQYESGTFLIKKGLPYGTHYTYHYLGADPATGMPVYETEDGGKTTDLARAGRFAKFGTFIPKHIGGFYGEFRIGKFTLSAFFSYQFDVVRSNNIDSWVTRGTAGYAGAVNQSKRLLTEQWQKPGDIAKYQAPAYDRDFTSTDLQDASFLRFRNLTLGYTLPQINIGSVKLIRSARAYVQAQNLYIWSPWRGPDPEDNNNISLNEYPNPRIFVAGLDVNF
jgi:TonB-linked SusC/RagA family outer membrane protein